MQVNYVKPQAEATVQQYQAESAATSSQADQAKWEGIGSVIAFGSACAMGGAMEYSDPKSPLKEPEDIVSQSETKLKPEEKDAIKDLEKTAKDTTKSDAERKEAQDQIDEMRKKALTRANSTKEMVMNFFSKGGKLLGSYLQKATQAATLANMLSEGTTKISVTAPHQMEQAKQQAQQGVCQATSQVAQQMSQYHSQSFSRNEDLRQRAGDNCKAAVDYITQLANGLKDAGVALMRG